MSGRVSLRNSEVNNATLPERPTSQLKMAESSTFVCLLPSACDGHGAHGIGPWTRGRQWHSVDQAANAGAWARRWQWHAIDQVGYARPWARRRQWYTVDQAVDGRAWTRGRQRDAVRHEAVALLSLRLR